ncbi:Phytocyanin domain [Sesbania bispinosa]|nr:Phytocyanin domain [Sesbania bispinosa]
MASSFTSLLLVLLLAILSGPQCFCLASQEFQVGGSKGWVVPPANDTNIYNEWASHNRFHIGDSIQFKYKKDSVMEVGEVDYKNCNATHPTFFSNNGNTVLRLDHSGTYYFISGASGHCQKGQKMIVRVMVPDESLPQHAKSSGYHGPIGVSEMLFLQFVLTCFASYVI